MSLSLEAIFAPRTRYLMVKSGLANNDARDPDPTDLVGRTVLYFSDAKPAQIPRSLPPRVGPDDKTSYP